MTKRSKDKLDRQTVKEIGQFLKEKKVQLVASVRSGMASSLTNTHGRSTDLGDWATESLEEEIHVALMDNQSDQLAQIEEALERLARREYGFCHDCGEPIGLGRLRALPFALRCSPCQSRAELWAR